jgi:D-glycero-D-manno-heptose 1,7-bisphosphate phosphatase
VSQISDAAPNEAPQCVILVEDSDARPGAAAGDTPLRRLCALIDNAARFGFRRILLLAGPPADRVRAWFPHGVHRTPGGVVSIEILVAPEPLGASGALRAAASALAPQFLLLTGAAMFDFNWLALCAPLAAGVFGRRALRRDVSPEAPSRGPDMPTSGPGDRNGGVYWLSRDILTLDFFEDPVLRERDAFSRAGAQGLQDVACEGPLLEVDDRASAVRRRGAVFFDRDGVLNVDHGYTHDIAKFQWLPGAREAVRLANDCGLYVFVVTNQSGVARGFYVEEDVRRLHAHMQKELRELGAHIDDFRFCPHHPHAKVAAYAGDCGWRKPRPGMILDLLAYWPVDAERSLLIGDKDSDLAAATAAGVRGVKTDGAASLEALLAAAL